MSFKWHEIILSEHSEDYPFFRFFKEPIKLTQPIISSVDSWMAEEYSYKGLIIIGPNRQHLLYLIAHYLGLPIVSVAELNSTVASMAADRAEFSKNYNNLLKGYISHVNAFDGIGSETIASKSLVVKDIIDKLWLNGQGIVGSVAIDMSSFSMKYGQETLDKMSKSCKLIELK